MLLPLFLIISFHQHPMAATSAHLGIGEKGVAKLHPPILLFLQLPATETSFDSSSKGLKRHQFYLTLPVLH